MIGKLIRFITPIVILAMAIGIVSALLKSRPTPIQKTAFSVPPSVRVMTVELKDMPLNIEGKGTVISARKVQLNPRVSGQIIERNKEMEAGGFVGSEEVLLRLDPKDFELAIQMKEAQVAKAKLALDIERGKKRVAEREWSLLGEQLQGDAAGKDLALRKPQIDSAKADLKGAKSALKQAKINLERTSILAPFDAIVLQGNAEIGQQIGPQSVIATLVDSRKFWIKVSIASRDLQKLKTFGSIENIEAKIEIDQKMTRKGKVLRALPELDNRGRMAQLLVEVEDPMGRLDSTGSTPSLILGSYVSVSISPGLLKGVAQIPRTALSDDKSVWVVDENSSLMEFPVQVQASDETSLLVSSELKEGALVVISPLAGPVKGMQVQIPGSSESTPKKDPSQTAEGGNTP